MRSGLIAHKLGMTQYFDKAGNQVPVTILRVEKCTVVDVKKNDVHGYTALQLGTKSTKKERLSKPLQGYFSKKNIEPLSLLKEFHVDDAHLLEVGSTLDWDHFSEGQFIDVTGVSIGKGFQGAMKRHGFGGLRASHGVSVSHRSHGSTGNRQDPGKVFKNKKMAGHMGATKVTTLNLVIKKIDRDKGLLYIHGCVPGAKNGVVYLRDAIKKKKTFS